MHVFASISMAHFLPCYLFISLLLLALLSTLGTSAPYHAVPKPEPRPNTKPVAASSPAHPSVVALPLLLACNATRFPSLCVSTLSSPSCPHSATPLALLTTSISAPLSSLPSAIATARSILSHSTNNANLSNAASNCIEVLTLSSYRLTAALKSISSPSHQLPSARIDCSAALLYQYDCWSAYKYVNDTKVINDAMAFLANNLTTMTSNALSMVAAMERYGNDTSLWGPPQTERDGYWPKATSLRSRIGSRTGGVPTNLKPTVTVCKNGTCKYHTIQNAVDAAPKKRSKLHVIYIRAGVYEETVRIPFEKTNLVFVGDGTGKTVITGSLNADMVGVSTYNTATVGINGDGFMARDLTFANTAGPIAHQAVAFRSSSDRSVLDSVEFIGHQDTIYAHSMRQYYTNCRILGTIDFIFGNSASIFNNCSIVVLPRQVKPHHGESNIVTAHGRTDPGQGTGFVFQNSLINGSLDYLALYRENSTAHKVYLGRPWKEYARTVFINCTMDKIIRPEGWSPWKEDFALATLFYGEYGSLGPGGNVTGRVPWSNQIPREHLGLYSVENFIQGDQWIPNFKGRK